MQVNGSGCSVAECGAKHLAKGLCKLHYERQKRTGTTDEHPRGLYYGMSDLEIIESNIVKGDGCWEWQGSRMVQGYGRVDRGARGVIKAHRLSFLVHNGYLPEVVCHRCDNPPCCRPDHLFPGDVLLNLRDMVKKGRQRAGRGSGHGAARLTETNVLDIRNRCASGERHAALAAEFGVSRSAIGAIVTGRNWKHVQPASINVSGVA